MQSKAKALTAGPLLALEHLEKRIFWSVAGTLLFLCFLYMYFLNQTVVNIVERKDTEQQIAAANTRLNELEFAYIQKESKLNLDLAYSMGFNDASDKKFLTRVSGSGLSLGGR